MEQQTDIEIRIVTAWDEETIADLYRAGGWWSEEWDPAALAALIRGSFAFAVAIDPATDRAVGMGRIISDGVSDGYIQDLVVLPEYRGRGIGSKVVSTLLNECTAAGLGWIGLIAEPGTDEFYLPLGFGRLEGYVPMRYYGER
ncbi:GNAT family N-acetyltransferase [Methanoculleus sp. FWC-SCC1]|uniref:GNAT family N-acetyltransferase n=1 Tax=Methanoculleus frigidifontis TaxID=2584085 RepID=A0ABT8M6E0_9EURY|nr:GNAT family N-acetyltransferase [Methanoculleus sp. FWC-SCC1]MDN7023502.1 GNAT family N-acetyltransferase [Methanoculleus sp. FWC-SCC1]